MKSIVLSGAALAAALCIAASSDGCEENSGPPPVSRSGARIMQVDVPHDQEGHTIEQENIAHRLVADNEPGAIKFLYVISAYSGDVLLYSTVKGKVTSSGKRLGPTSVSTGSTRDSWYGGIPVDIGGGSYHTSEVLQDDGSYGSSVEYLYWWDAQGRYHQHYPSGGQIIHISDAPLVVPKVIINLSADAAK